MNLGMLATILLLTNFSFRLWRLVVDRGLRWELHAIRDELRWLAIADADVRAREAVQHFDFALSFSIGNLERLSIWTLFASGGLAPPSQEMEEEYREFRDDLEADERTKVLYDRYSEVLGRRLRSRHWPLVLCFLIAKPLFRYSLKEQAARSAFSVPGGMAAAH